MEQTPHLPMPPSLQNNINAKSGSTSAHLAPENRRPGTEHRSARRPSTLPWSRGSGGGLQHDGPGAFLLDLHNFPDLSKADINGQNPNIQVRAAGPLRLRASAGATVDGKMI